VARAGVASGVAFCGAIQGGDGRYAGFTMLSSKGVTLAARLMCSAPMTGGALCAPSVHDLSVRDGIQYLYAPRPDEYVKGLSGDADGVKSMTLKGMAYSFPYAQPIGENSNPGGGGGGGGRGGGGLGEGGGGGKHRQQQQQQPLEKISESGAPTRKKKVSARGLPEVGWCRLTHETHVESAWV